MVQNIQDVNVIDQNQSFEVRKSSCTFTLSKNLLNIISTVNKQ